MEQGRLQPRPQTPDKREGNRGRKFPPGEKVTYNGQTYTVVADMGPDIGWQAEDIILLQNENFGSVPSLEPGQNDEDATIKNLGVPRKELSRFNAFNRTHVRPR